MDGPVDVIIFLSITMAEVMDIVQVIFGLWNIILEGFYFAIVNAIHTMQLKRY